MAMVVATLCLYAQKSTTSLDVTIEMGKKTNTELMEDRSILVTLATKDIDQMIGRGYITYNNMGAIGDGASDDMPYIVATHAVANEYGLSVRANQDACYYIGGRAMTAIIATETNFGQAKFIIDDTQLEDHRSSVFEVTSGLKPYRINDIQTLKKGQKEVEISLPQTCLVKVQDNDTKQFIRKGQNQNEGESKMDLFILDKNGKVDMRAPIIWDFNNISEASVVPVSKSTLKITGGNFTTIANQDSSEYNYHNRNIDIHRSNVIVDGIQHTIVEEKDHGAPYGGFIYIHDCAFVSVKNSILTGHKTYKTIGSAGQEVSMGSYDILVNRALHISFINCKQTNDIMNVNFWGIMSSNYSKNLLYENCSFSRFDAHMGVANATIRNSSLGHMGINAIGCGTFVIENSTVRGRSLVNLRPDYGSTWQGKIIIKNCIFAPRQDQLHNASIIGGTYTGDHDFGYQCYMPQQIYIKNLKIIDSKCPDDYRGMPIFANFNPTITNSNYKELYPYIVTEKVVISNSQTASGKPLMVSNNQFMFKNVEITYID